MNERRGSDTVIGRALTAATGSDGDYKWELRQCRGFLKDIENVLKDHEARQKKDPDDYGYVGDLAHAAGNLVEVIRFLRGQG